MANSDNLIRSILFYFQQLTSAPVIEASNRRLSVKKSVKKAAKKVRFAIDQTKKVVNKKVKNMKKGAKTMKRTTKRGKKQRGGRVAMPIEYYGGESNQWTDNKNATTAAPLGNNETWNNFQVGEMTMF